MPFYFEKGTGIYDKKFGDSFWNFDRRLLLF